MNKNKKRPLKIFMGPGEIAGTFTRLSDGFDILGVENCFLNIAGHRFNYKKTVSKKENFFNSKFQKLHELKQRNNLLIRMWAKVAFYLLLMPLFIYCMIKFNAFIFVYGNHFFSRLPIKQFRYLDLLILKFFHKKTIFLYVGNDSRPIYVGSPKHNFDYDFKEIAKETRLQKERIKYVEKYADYIIDCPFQQCSEG